MCFDYSKFWHMDKATWNMAKSKTLWTSDKPKYHKITTERDFKLILKTYSISIDFYFIVLI